MTIYKDWVTTLIKVIIPPESKGMVRLSFGGKERKSVNVAAKTPRRSIGKATWVIIFRMLPKIKAARQKAKLPSRLLPLIFFFPHLSPAAPPMGSPTARKVKESTAIVLSKNQKAITPAISR